MTEVHFSDYKKYFNDYEWNLEIHEKETWDKLNTILKNYKNFVFLDIGCQKGIYSMKVLEEFKNSEVFGFDVLKHPEIESLELVKNFTFINKPIGNEKKLILKSHMIRKLSLKMYSQLL